MRCRWNFNSLRDPYGWAPAGGGRLVPRFIWIFTPNTRAVEKGGIGVGCGSVTGRVISRDLMLSYMTLLSFSRRNRQREIDDLLTYTKPFVFIRAQLRLISLSLSLVMAAEFPVPRIKDTGRYFITWWRRRHHFVTLFLAIRSHNQSPSKEFRNLVIYIQLRVELDAVFHKITRFTNWLLSFFLSRSQQVFCFSIFQINTGENGRRPHSDPTRKTMLADLLDD